MFSPDLGENYFIFAQLITYRYKKDQNPFRGNQMASYFPDILRVFNLVKLFTTRDRTRKYRVQAILPLGVVHRAGKKKKKRKSVKKKKCQRAVLNYGSE